MIDRSFECYVRDNQLGVLGHIFRPYYIRYAEFLSAAKGRNYGKYLWSLCLEDLLILCTAIQSLSENSESLQARRAGPSKESPDLGVRWSSTKIWDGNFPSMTYAYIMESDGRTCLVAPASSEFCISSLKTPFPSRYRPRSALKFAVRSITS